jgi:hypothetical protein
MVMGHLRVVIEDSPASITVMRKRTQENTGWGKNPGQKNTARNSLALSSLSLKNQAERACGPAAA